MMFLVLALLPLPLLAWGWMKQGFTADAMTGDYGTTGMGVGMVLLMGPIYNLLWVIPAVVGGLAGWAIRQHILRKSFEARRERADFAAFDRIMARTGGQPPEGDDIL